MTKERAALASVIEAMDFSNQNAAASATAIIVGLAAAGFVVRFSPPEAKALKLPGDGK